MSELGFCLQCGTPLQARVQEDRERPTCPTCGFIHYLDPKVAVAVVLGDERGVFLGKRCIDPGSGLWSFPAGYVNRGEVLWRDLLPRTPLQPDARRVFEDELTEIAGVSYVRFNIFPDGGVARLRLFGRPT